MRTLGLVVTLGLALLAAPFAAEAQQGGKVPRIGFLVWQAGPPPGPWRDAFLQGLRDVGYVVGQNIAVERRYGKEDQLLTLAAELVRLKVDVIVTTGTPAALAAKEATQTIPIVALWMGDPVASGLVTSLGRPGGDRKSTRLNSSHVRISYAVFCLKKKKINECLLHIVIK